MKWASFLAAIALPLQIINAQTPPEGQEPVAVPDEQQHSAPVPTDLAPTVSEVLRLSESGVGDQVVLAYIQNAQTPFNLSADHILYLRDLGLSQDVMTAMLNHDKGLPVQMSATTPPPANQYPQPGPATQPPAEVPPPSEPVTAPLTPTYVSNPPVEVNYFYNDLSPYGEWVSLDGFGWCWQPRAVVVNRGWRPYCDGGHWIYTDAGWYWQSDYSWGWAPFHYGRWHLHDRCGWVWIPDTTWAPAWVVWRSSGDYCGWAPVPPHAVFDARFGWRYNGISVGVNFDFGLRERDFFFIGLHDFHHHDLYHYRVPPTQVTRIYNRTTVINNYTVNNNRIVNRGLPVERVSAATHTEFRKVSVREGGAAGGGSRVVTRSADRSVVYQPTLRSAPRTERITAQRVDASHPVVQHTEIARMERNSSVNRGPRGSESGAFRGQERTYPGQPVRPQDRATLPNRSPERSTVERNPVQTRGNERTFERPQTAPNTPNRNVPERSYERPQTAPNVPSRAVPERTFERPQTAPNTPARVMPDRQQNDRRAQFETQRSVESARTPAEVPRTAPLRPDTGWRPAPQQSYEPKSGQQAAENSARYERSRSYERPSGSFERPDRGNSRAERPDRSDRSDRSDRGNRDDRGRKN